MVLYNNRHKGGISMAGIIRYSFERYENKYFLTLQQYAHIIEDIRPYVKEDDYGRYTIWATSTAIATIER